MTLKLLDTFAGIGGFSYAAEQLVGGFETTQFVEIEPYCQKILKKHWPNVPIHDDIKTFTARPFQFDCIAGGFPCQDVSVAGQQRGITKKTRSGLFYELIRVIRMVRPKYVLLENVAALLNNGMGIVLGELSEIGYDAEWKVISARERGACHLRQRVWIIAYPHNNGQQRGELKARNKNVAGQNSQVKWSANTENIERHNNDGSNKTKPGTNENLSRPSNGGEATSSNTRGICKLSEGANDNKRVSPENTNKKNNNRTLVSQGQEGIQLPLDRTLASNQTTLENNKVRHGNDNNTNKGMDKQGEDVTNTQSKGLERQDRGLQDKGIRSDIARHSRPVANSQYDGSSTTKKSRSIEESDGRATQGENKACKFKGSSKPGDSRAFQHDEKFANTKDISSNVRESRDYQKKEKGEWEFRGCDSRYVTKSLHEGLQGFRGERELPEGGRERQIIWRSQPHTLNPNWRGYISEPTLRRGDDGLSNRVHRLKALGNSIVPAVATIPLGRILDLHKEN